MKTSSTIIISICSLLVIGTTWSAIHSSKRIQQLVAEKDDIEVLLATQQREIELLRATRDQPAVQIADVATPVVVDSENVSAEWERQLAAKDAEIAALRAGMITTPVPDVMRNTPPEDRRNWLENLQTSDPVRYQEIMESREAARQTARYEIAKRAAHFLFRDSAAATEEEQEQYGRMMTLLHESLTLTEKLNAETPPEDRREIGRTLRQNMRELAPMLETERDRELFRVGKDLGYTDDDAASFALYLRDVIDMTSVQSIFRNSMQALGGGWGRGGGWGGGDRPPTP